MRAKVATVAGGHPFENRFMKMDPLQLAISYRHAVKVEEERFDLLNTINEVWAKKIDNLFEVLYLFVDRDMFKVLQDAKETEKYREELKPEEFPAIWDELMQFVPTEIIAEESASDPLANLPKVDDEMGKMLTGFIPYKAKIEGEKDANG